MTIDKNTIENILNDLRGLRSMVDSLSINDDAKGNLKTQINLPIQKLKRIEREL